jgi:hypothetical protein
LLHGSFLLFNPANLGRARPPIENRRQLLQLAGSADRVNLYAAIVFIANPAAHADVGGVLLDEPSEPDTLHSSRNKPSARLKFQRPDSLPRAGLESLITALISCRKLMIVKGFVIRRRPLSKT